MTPADRSFAVTWDYRCPFARVAVLHVLAGLRDGASWNVEFVPFSLKQMHVDEGELPVWDEPDKDSGLLALRTGVVVRDDLPDSFHAVHRALFDARHVHGRDLRDEKVLRSILQENGVDPEAVFERVLDGTALQTVRKEHEAAVESHDVWGVPTFISGDRAVFVRLMEPPADGADGRRSIERILDLLDGWPQLNEFKHTTRDR